MRIVTHIAAALIIAAAGVAVYFDTVSSYCWMEQGYSEITSRSALRDASLGGALRLFAPPATREEGYAPVKDLSHLLNYAVLHRFSVASFHLGNILLHVLAALLLYLLIVRLSHRSLPALLAALLFAVHPVNSTVVMEVTAREYMLAGIFSLLALLSYVSFTESSGLKRQGLYFLSLASFAAGLLSVTTGFFIPAVIGLYEVFVARPERPARERWRTAGKRLLPFIALQAAHVLLVRRFSPGDDICTWLWQFYGADWLFKIIGATYEYLHAVLFMTARYGELGEITLYPGLSDPGFYLTRLAALCLLLLLFYYAAVIRKERWSLVFAGLFAFGLLPGLLCVQPTHAFFKPYVYIASGGLFPFAALLFEQCGRMLTGRLSPREGYPSLLFLGGTFLLLFLPGLYRGQFHQAKDAAEAAYRHGAYANSLRLYRKAISALYESNDPSRDLLGNSIDNIIRNDLLLRVNDPQRKDEPSYRPH